MLPGVNGTSRVVIAVLFGVAFAISSILRGDVAPGLVGGALAAVLVWLVIGRVQEYNERARARHRQREPE